MKRIPAVVLHFTLVVVPAFSGTTAEANFLISGYLSGTPSQIRDNGTFLRSYIVPPGLAETVDAFALSADQKFVYVFGNNLGSIANFKFDTATGEFLGGAGSTPYVFGSWPDGLLPNIGVGNPLTRGSLPAGGGNLFFRGGPDFLNSPAPSFINLLNIFDTSTGSFVGQVVPPEPTLIADFAFGPGALGPQSKLFLATPGGLFAYQETPTSGGTTFEPISTTPLVPSSFSHSQIEVGPDGLIYALSGSNVNRYNATDGSLVDTLLTAAEFNPQHYGVIEMRFGPDGDIYFASSEFIAGSTMIKFNTSTGVGHTFTALTMTGFISFQFGDFAVLSVPEPNSLLLLLAAVGTAFALFRRRRN